MAAPAINGARLWATLAETALFGADDEGGINRLTLSPEDVLVRDWLAREARAIGCEVTSDALGSMFITRPGRRTDLAPIAMGSHLDTQPTGGRFDGVLGVLAGLEVLRSLDERGITTEHPLMLVNWTNEEGARFAPAMLCSGVHAGQFSLDFALSRQDRDGVSLAETLQASGWSGPLVPGAQRFAAMYELHIEQGPILERESRTIGVVTGVQGARWFDLELVGMASHAGSTPMEMRSDALLAAARVMVALNRYAAALGGYATVGEISVASPSRNVVPGLVRMTIDLRHEADAGLEALEMALRDCLAEESHLVQHQLMPVWVSPPVSFDEGCIAQVRRAAQARGYAFRDITSGAGHDSVYVARVAPTSMIFVPCKGGISHNPAESATSNDCAAGAQILMDVVLATDLALSATARKGTALA